MHLIKAEPKNVKKKLAMEKQTEKGFKKTKFYAPVKAAMTLNKN